MKAAINPRGFTLIELMIVIAIIGVLAAVAVPQYLQFSNRSFVSSEAFSAARPFQLAINEYFIAKQTLPQDASYLKLNSLTGETSRVESVSMATGGAAKLTVLFKSTLNEVPARVQGLTLVLQPEIDSVSDGISWSINDSESTLPTEYLPNI